MVTSDNSSSKSGSDHETARRKRRRERENEKDNRRRNSHYDSRSDKHHRRCSRDREDRRNHRDGESHEKKRRNESPRREDRYRNNRDGNSRHYGKKSRDGTDKKVDDSRSHHSRNTKSKNNEEKKNSFLESVKMKQELVPEWGKATVKSEPQNTAEKEKPNFGLSGKLTEDVNTVNGVVIKYSEPADARKPKRRWRLYPFKGEKVLPTLYIHRQSAFLLGRDRKVADIPLDHPSCSKQHAALQYRLVPFKKENGYEGKRVRPYLIDLDSANGTYVNNVKLEPRKFHELLERDVIKFGFSSREYVLLHEHSKDDELDDDVQTSNNAQE